jgi:hypothetical protein
MLWITPLKAGKGLLRVANTRRKTELEYQQYTTELRRRCPLDKISARPQQDTEKQILLPRARQAAQLGSRNRDARAQTKAQDRAEHRNSVVRRLIRSGPPSMAGARHSLNERRTSITVTT